MLRSFLRGTRLARRRRSVEHHDDGPTRLDKRLDLGPPIFKQRHLVVFQNEIFSSVIRVDEFVHEKVAVDVNDAIMAVSEIRHLPRATFLSTRQSPCMGILPS